MREEVYMDVDVEVPVPVVAERIVDVERRIVVVGICMEPITVF